MIPMDVTRKIENATWRLMRYFKTQLDSDGLVPFLSEILDLKTDDVESRVQVLRKYHAQVAALNALPKVQQRSEEWYNMRKERLTASDTAQALGKSKYGKPGQLVQKKAFPEKYPMISSMSVAPLRHGIIYESMALRCYVQRHANIQVHEFGLIPHPTLDCYGASPDGITELGIMLEIKCPLKRVIDGTIPENYYYQMQGQMAVCQLEECDYIECDILETQDEAEYISTVDANATKDHGIVLQRSDDSLVYSPEDMTPENAIQWMKDNRNTGDRVNYWILRKIAIQRVKFDREKWTICEPIIVDFWKQVVEARNNAPAPSQVKKYAFLDDD